MPKHIESVWFFLVFSVLYVQKSECYACNQLAILTKCSADSQAACFFFFLIPNCSAEFVQDFLDHYVDHYQILMGYFSLSCYLFNFKPSHEVLKFYAITFLKNSQLFFQIYSGFSGSLCGSMSVQ